MGVGPDDTRGAGYEEGAQDDRLPGHEQDEQRMRPAEIAEADPADVAGQSDSSQADAELPAYEDDRRRLEDTGTGQQNP